MLVTKGYTRRESHPLFRGGHYLQFDFIRILQYTIVNECNYKVIYREIMVEYLSIKRTVEKWGITVRRIQVLYTEGRIPEPARLAHIGLFLQTLRNQIIKELRVVNVSRGIGILMDRSAFIKTLIEVLKYNRKYRTIGSRDQLLRLIGRARINIVPQYEFINHDYFLIRGVR